MQPQPPPQPESILAGEVGATGEGPRVLPPLRGRASPPRAVVVHGTSCFYLNESITFHKRDSSTIFIGRFMIERIGFHGGFTNDEFYVAHCAALVLQATEPLPWGPASY